MQNFFYTSPNGMLQTPAYKYPAAILYRTGFRKRLTTLLHIKDIMEPLDIDYLQLKASFPKVWEKFMDSGRDLWQFCADHSIWGTLIDKALVDAENYAWEVRYFDHDQKSHTRYGMCEEKKSAYNQMMFAIFGLIEKNECFDWRLWSENTPNTQKGPVMSPEQAEAYSKTQQYLHSVTKAANDRHKRNKYFRNKR